MPVPSPDLSRTAAVVLDVDGTIAGADHRVSDRTLRAMGALERAGVPVLIATGRTRSNAVGIARAAGLTTPVVAGNGGLVVDPRTDEILRLRTVPESDLAAMVTLHRITGQPLTWWTPDRIFATGGPLAEVLARINDAEVTVAGPDAIEPDTVVKTMVSGTRDELDAIGPEIARLVPRAMRSMDEFWELSGPEASKWAAIGFILDRLGIDPARVAGAGDGGNDAIWMSRIGWPVAMGNARPEAMAAARAVIGRHDREGAAEFLEDIAGRLPARTD